MLLAGALHGIAAHAQSKTLTMQASWPASSTFMENFTQFADRVNKTTGGRLQIKTSAAGTIVPAFEVTDATHKGVIDGAHTWSGYLIGKHPAAVLFTGGPGGPFGMDLFDHLGWFYDGGGQQLMDEWFETIIKRDEQYAERIQQHPPPPPFAGVSARGAGGLRLAGRGGGGGEGGGGGAGAGARPPRGRQGAAGRSWATSSSPWSTWPGTWRIDAEEALRAANGKFRARFAAMEGAPPGGGEGAGGVRRGRPGRAVGGGQGGGAGRLTLRERPRTPGPLPGGAREHRGARHPSTRTEQRIGILGRSTHVSTPVHHAPAPPPTPRAALRRKRSGRSRSGSSPTSSG